MGNIRYKEDTPVGEISPLAIWYAKNNANVYSCGGPRRDRNYNTILTPEQEAKYREWVKTLPANLQSDYDYDLRGAWLVGDVPDENGHMTDYWKKPWHPTFSVESRYSSTETPGGEWHGEEFAPSWYNNVLDGYRRYWAGNEFAKGGYKAYSKSADKLNEEYGIDMSMSKRAFRQNRKNAWAGLEQSQRVAEQLASQTPYQMTPSERVENYIEGNNIPVDAGNYVYNYRQAKQQDAYKDYVSYMSQLANPTAASFANRVAERPDYRGIADLELALATAVDPYMLLSDGVGPTVQSVANYVSKKMPKINVSNLRRIVPAVEKQYEVLSNLKGTAAADKIFQMTNKPIPGGASPRRSIIDYFPSTDNLSSLLYFDMSPFEVKKRAFKDLKRIKVGGMFTETNLSTDSYPLVLNMMQTKHTPNFEIIPTGHMTRLNTHGKLGGDAAVNRINKKIMLLNADRGMTLPMAKYVPASSPESIQNALRLNTDAILQEGHAYNSPLPVEELHFSDEYWVPELYAKRLYQKGGSIHIKPENRGKFTAAANRAGKSVQAYASQILANKENYSPTLVKRANFARNAAKWHAEGGQLYDLTPLEQYYINNAGNIYGLGCKIKK